MTNKNCFDCKYLEIKDGKYICTHPYGGACVNCSLWWGKDVGQAESEE